MSVCLETNNVLANQVGTVSTSQLPEQSSSENAPVPSVPPSTSLGPHVSTSDQPQQQVLPTKAVTKLLVSNHQTSVVGPITPVLQKIPNPPVITVLNSTGGPLTVLKTICVTSGVSSAPHFSLVNNQALSVTNALGKTPTITLLNAPVTVVKVPPQQQQNIDKSIDTVNSPIVTTQNVPNIIENRTHNVFVKNTCSDSCGTDIPQSHKFLTANSFPQTNVLASVTPVPGKTVNGQRSKLKILSNVIVPGIPGTCHTQQPANLILNKPVNPQQQQQQQRMVPRQKVLGPGGNQTKYVNKIQNNVQKTSSFNMKQVPDKQALQQPRIMYPTHKSQLKTLPPVNNYMQKVHGIKTLTPQQTKSIPGQVQRTGSGLRTIPPQRPPKLPNKLNYIGKHAVQAQKVKQSAQARYGGGKNLKQGGLPAYNNFMPPVHANKQLAFNQALTAEILETLSNKSGPTTSYSSKNYEILPNRYETNLFVEQKQPEPIKYEDKNKLDALSLICQAVLLDHNYNATLPPESPTRSAPILQNVPSQINGTSANSMLSYSPVASTKNKYPPERKRTLSLSNSASASSSMSNMSSLIPSNTTSLINLQDDDAASDISDCSDRKHDTEGEETDTAPEAEAVANDEPYDHYGDYVTRCICGFLHDDGYMVECDQCKVWQHVQCVVKNKQIPDEYLCEKCNPMKPVDPHKARLIQQQWLRERQQLPDLKNFKKEIKIKEAAFKHKEIATESDSSDAENPRHNNNTVVSKARTSLANRKKPEKPMGRQKKDLKEPNAQRKTFKKRERKMVRRKSKLQVKNTEEDNHDAFASTQLPQLRQWIENYEEAMTNHYSPELRARISNIRVNGAHATDTSMPFDPSVNKCRVHTQPLTDLKYLVATINIPPDTPIIELRGKYMLSTQHRNVGGSLTTRQHAQRPGPFLFFYRLHKDNTEVCVDTRTYGNSARFVRRSCKPNAELRHCIEKGVLHLYIVTVSAVDKNAELTIKHESHDLAAVGTTQIACYCGLPDDCKINKTTTVKKNGETTTEVHRKRRGRRTTSASIPSEPETPPIKIKEEPVLSPPLPPPPPPSPPPVKVKIEEMEVDVKKECPEVKEEEEKPVQLTEIKQEDVETKEERPITPIEAELPPSAPETPKKEEIEIKEEKESPKLASVVSTRRSSQHKVEKDKDEEKPPSQKQEKSKNKKLSREERKLEAILRAIEQMEKADQRKQEHKQTKHVQRRESEPSPHCKEEEKCSEPKQKRKRRKGRARTTSTHSARRDRLNSGDSYFTSGDENMLSPNEGMVPKKADESTDDSTSGKHEGLLLALSVNEDSIKREKSPVRENDSNSNSAQSSPETPLSLACSLVQAAVEPLESGFKFPKTKKGLMNEWLNKGSELVPNTPSPLSPHINNADLDTGATGFYTPTKNLPNSCPNETGPRGSAKKRWLRQAISEDKCDSPQESPPLSDSVAPPKKRRLPRESISNDSSPPSTPTSLTPSVNRSESTQEGCVEIVYSGAECEDSPTETLESDAVLKERAAEMKQEFSKCVVPSPPVSEVAQRPDTLSFGCLMDPRLRNHHTMFSNSDHLVGTVEKTLSILGFEERKPEAITPAKRKLSITEYRQRKKLNNNETNDKSEETCILEDCVNEENNSSESFKHSHSRTRLNSTSSSSATSSDDETSVIPELPTKAPAFNSEPTELERQREMQSMRLKKAFGLSIDVEPRKPALDMEAILNCDLPVLHAIKPQVPLDSPNCSRPGSCEPTAPDLTKSVSNSPRLDTILSQPTSPILSPDDMKDELDEEEATAPVRPTIEEEPPKEVVPPIAPETSAAEEEAAPEESMEDESSSVVDVGEELPAVEAGERTDDEDDSVKPHMFYTPDEEETTEKSFPEIESISYVPPFNNPIYPSTNYTSVIDEEGRYEGRNPSPPPSHLDSVDDSDT